MAKAGTAVLYNYSHTLHMRVCVCVRICINIYIYIYVHIRSGSHSVYIGTVEQLGIAGSYYVQQQQQ